MGATLRLFSLVVIALATIPAPAVAADPGPETPFAVATDEVFTEARNDGRQGVRGTWRLEAGRIEAGDIRLRLVIEPPARALPVQSGPAVLFGGLSLFGDAGGDMATGEQVDALASVVLPPCDDAGCRYVAEIAIPTADLLPAIRRLEEHGSLMWASANLTLVRTFGEGTWLQVLPFYTGGEGGPLDGAAGRLGAIEPVDGTLFPFGLFPATEATPVPGERFVSGMELDYRAVVEGLRAQSDDPTRPPPVAPVRLRVGIRQPCENAAVLTMHDDGGAWIFTAVAADGVPLTTVDETIELPVGIPWRLTLHDGGGIDFDQGRQGWGIRLGPIASDGTPMVVDATFNCARVDGELRLSGGIVQPTTEASTPQATASGAVEERTPLGGTPVGVLAIVVVLGLVALLGIGGWRRRSNTTR